MAALRKLAKGGWVDKNQETVVANGYRKSMNIKAPSVAAITGKLSGGNQQKVVLSKWMFSDPDVLILDEPTRGIDVGAKFEIYTIIAEARRRRKGGHRDLLRTARTAGHLRQDLHPVRRPHHRRGAHRRSIAGNPHALHDQREGIANMSALRESLGFLTSRLRQVGIFVALILIVLLFQVLTDGILLQPQNVTNLVVQNSYILILAIGMVMVIIAGHIDLSVGSVAGFIGAVAGVMIVHWGWAWWLAIPACLLVGALVGAWQGYWIAYVGIPAFIVTLAGHADFPRPDPDHPQEPADHPVPGRTAGPGRRLPAGHLRRHLGAGVADGHPRRRRHRWRC